MVTYPVSQWAVGIFSKTPSVNDHVHGTEHRHVRCLLRDALPSKPRDG